MKNIFHEPLLRRPMNYIDTLTKNIFTNLNCYQNWNEHYRLVKFVTDVNLTEPEKTNLRTFDRYTSLIPKEIRFSHKFRVWNYLLLYEFWIKCINSITWIFFSIENQTGIQLHHTIPTNVVTNISLLGKLKLHLRKL